jgi:hypothetical protein
MITIAPFFDFQVASCNRFIMKRGQFDCGGEYGVNTSRNDDFMDECVHDSMSAAESDFHSMNCWLGLSWPVICKQ